MLARDLPGTAGEIKRSLIHTRLSPPKAIRRYVGAVVTKLHEFLQYVQSRWSFRTPSNTFDISSDKSDTEINWPFYKFANWIDSIRMHWQNNENIIEYYVTICCFVPSWKISVRTTLWFSITQYSGNNIRAYKPLSMLIRTLATRMVEESSMFTGQLVCKLFCLIIYLSNLKLIKEKKHLSYANDDTLRYIPHRWKNLFTSSNFNDEVNHCPLGASKHINLSLKGSLLRQDGRPSQRNTCKFLTSNEAIKESGWHIVWWRGTKRLIIMTWRPGHCKIT